MNASGIILLITQLLPLITKLVSEIQNIQELDENDKQYLKNAVTKMKEKVAGITWKE